jgi:N-carbamoylputrescine amidase
MKIALVQQHATTDKAENVRRGLAALERAAGLGARLVGFAELAFERFHPQRPAAGDVARLAEPVPGPVTSAFQERARALGVVIVLNLFERDGARTYDCSPVIDADGRLLGRTRMLHITDYACFHEQGYYAPGDTGAPVTTRQGPLAWPSVRPPLSGVHARTCSRWRRPRRRPAGRRARRVARGTVRG